MQSFPPVTSVSKRETAKMREEGEIEEKKVSNQLYLTDKCALDLEWNSDMLLGQFFRASFKSLPL